MLTRFFTIFILSALLSRADVTPAPITEGKQITLGVTVQSGTPPLSFAWFKAKPSPTAISGATGVTYVIPSALIADSNTYYVVVSNIAGSTTSDNAILTIVAVTVAPIFTTQPSNQTITAGGSVTFTATASGTPAPTYQWFKGTTAIVGATSASLTIANVTAADAASYTVVATNSAGSVTSSVATLSVNTKPVISGISVQTL